MSRQIRERCGFSQSLFALRGNVILPDFQAAREFATKLNATRPKASQVRASELNAMGLIDELLHALVAEYRQENAGVLSRALLLAKQNFGSAAVQHCLKNFVEAFPPVRVYQNKETTDQYLAGQEQNMPNEEAALEELLMLHMANLNPAFKPFQELFDDSQLVRDTVYAPLMQMLETFLEREPKFKFAGGVSLWRALRLPAIQHPNSLSEQLKFLMQRFGVSLERLGATLALRFRGVEQRLHQSLGFLSEEARPDFAGFFGPPEIGFPRSQAELSHEPENFTPDQIWMPELVLVAKNALVWLHQLSNRYGREIKTLDQVPNEELAHLRSQGITGIWLIGLWQRSLASRKIKNIMGNPDAAASAYSLIDYSVSDELGGDAACNSLQHNAWQHGIRIGSDMVPNHTGIDGRWLFEHPDYFVQLDNAPYPSYTFNGPNLSSHSGTEIYLEDGYYNHSDAAVVFKYAAHGRTRYIYHGNDGTGLPWNDTAQLDYLKQEVRDAVRQEIVRVAKRFPIVRFDAAMTLAKRHVRRLWYPAPGQGGAIATRSDHALTDAEFEAAMPEEFWREVVETCATEAPDTLLLAEAFWMMEGYFVRSLGMHRVYNSAFMHMLRDEKNTEYQKILRDMLALEPGILKRFVNFLNNPDEETAAQQFGKGDKYFGIMTLCVALPGLPMIGHGQMEGLEEKYGMEYRRAMLDEQPDLGFIDHHNAQISPLLHKRVVFSDVENFAILEFETSTGLNDNVYAFSNRHNNERALIVYNNSHSSTRGQLRAGAMGRGRRTSLNNAMGLESGEKHFAIWREQVSGLEFLAPSKDLQLHFELGPYQRKVLLHWYEVWDEHGQYRKLWTELNGRGVQNVHQAIHEHVVVPAASNTVPEIVVAELARKNIATKKQKATPKPKTPKPKTLKPKTEKVKPVVQKAKPEKQVVQKMAVQKVIAPKPMVGLPVKTKPVVREVVVEKQVVETPIVQKASVQKTAVVKNAESKASIIEPLVDKVVDKAKVNVSAKPEKTKPVVQQSNLKKSVAKKTTAIKTTIAKTIKASTAKAEVVQSLAKPKTVEPKVIKQKSVVTTVRPIETKSETSKAKTVQTKVSLPKPVIVKPSLKKTVAKKSVIKKPAIEKPVVKKPVVKKTSAKKQADDLTIVLGIGPKIAKALIKAGIDNFAALARSPEKKLRAALDAAKIQVAPSLPSWAQQAAVLGKKTQK